MRCWLLKLLPRLHNDYFIMTISISILHRYHKHSAALTSSFLGWINAMMNVMPAHWPCPQHICQHDQHDTTWSTHTPFFPQPHPYHPDVDLHAYCTGSGWTGRCNLVCWILNSEENYGFLFVFTQFSLHSFYSENTFSNPVNDQCHCLHNW